MVFVDHRSMKIKKYFYFLVFFITGIFLFCFALFYAFPYYLVVNKKPPDEVDVILNLSGDFGRVVYTAELAHRYPSAQILITWAEIPFNSKILEEAGVEFPLNKDVMRKLLIVKGVEEYRVGVIGKWLTSTLEEALALKKYWQSNSFNKLVVVTSPVHSRRVELTFHEIFKDTDVEISVLSDPYDSFNSGKWWKNEGSLLSVVSEGLKILLYRYKFVTEDF